MTESNTFQQLAKKLNEGGMAFEQGDYPTAIRLWLEILAESPDWDKGRLHRSLAQAYLKVGEIEKSRLKFLEALSYDSEDSDTRDEYAYLLWNHGDPRQAFGQYLLLADTYRRQRVPPEWIDALMVPLSDLGSRLGMTEGQVRAYLKPSGRDSASQP